MELAAELAFTAQLDVDAVIKGEPDEIERLLYGAAQLDISVVASSLHCLSAYLS
jgi:hypothetical protein